MTDHSARSDASASSSGEPSPQHDHVPTLDTARRIARKALDRYQGANVHDPRALVEAHGALTTSLATLLDALDNEVPR